MPFYNNPGDFKLFKLKFLQMKKLFLFVISFFTLTAVLIAQKPSESLFSDKFATGIDVFNDFVMDAPDGIKFRTINPGVSIYGMHTFPVKESNFAFAIGLGLGMHNLFSDATLQDTSGVSFFQAIPENQDYKKSKLSLTYLDVPAELRFKTEGGFKVAVGIKVGMLINAHTKYKGDDPADGSKTKIKVSQLPNLQTWRFGPSFQIGYKWINLTAFYSLSKIFEENAGPEIYPVSVGISLRPF